MTKVVFNKSVETFDQLFAGQMFILPSVRDVLMVKLSSVYRKEGSLTDFNFAYLSGDRAGSLGGYAPDTVVISINEIEVK